MKRTILALGLTLTLSGLLTGVAHAQLTRPDGAGPFSAVGCDRFTWPGAST